MEFCGNWLPLHIEYIPFGELCQPPEIRPVWGQIYIIVFDMGEWYGMAVKLIKMDLGRLIPHKPTSGASIHRKLVYIE